MGVVSEEAERRREPPPSLRLQRHRARASGHLAHRAEARASAFIAARFSQAIGERFTGLPSGGASLRLHCGRHHVVRLQDEASARAEARASAFIAARSDDRSPARLASRRAEARASAFIAAPRFAELPRIGTRRAEARASAFIAAFVTRSSRSAPLAPERRREPPPSLRRALRACGPLRSS